jgi:hypothetical protein
VLVRTCAGWVLKYPECAVLVGRSVVVMHQPTANPAREIEGLLVEGPKPHPLQFSGGVGT